jgi:hypothetical protein
MLICRSAVKTAMSYERYRNDYGPDSRVETMIDINDLPLSWKSELALLLRSEIPVARFSPEIYPIRGDDHKV